jgi:ring-1,2-phenylacetyl-CoA epoxidase subunit PaaD
VKAERALKDSFGTFSVPKESFSAHQPAHLVAEGVTDPELPVVTLAELGVLRGVDVGDGGRVVVTVTPTYSGCPAMDEIRADLRRKLHEAGYREVEVRTVLSPAWTTDWITEEGRRKLAAYGIAPPGPAEARPVTLRLTAPVRKVDCPLCGSGNTTELSRFSSTACKALYRCEDCREPFEYMKEH